MRRAQGLLGLALAAMLAAGCGSGPPRESVSGTIRLAPSLPPEVRRLRHLFIYLEPAQGGPPFAIQRLVEPAFPYHFIMTPDDMFARGRVFSGQVRVRARLLDEKLIDYELDPLRGSKPAAPLVRGSYEGTSARPAAVGAQDVEVVIGQAGAAEPPKEVAKKPEAPARGAQAPATPPPVPQAQARPPAPPQAPAAPQPSAPPQASATPAPPRAPAPSGGSEGPITGTIVLAPALAGKGGGKRAVFLIARPEQGGAPLAVVRIPDPKFPLAFRISQEHVMMPGVRFEGRVRLVARVDADGSAGPPQKGDLEGQTSGVVAAGSSGVTIVVDKEY